MRSSGDLAPHDPTEIRASINHRAVARRGVASRNRQGSKLHPDHPQGLAIGALVETAEKLSQTRRKAAKLNAGNPIDFEVSVPCRGVHRVITERRFPDGLTDHHQRLDMRDP